MTLRRVAAMVAASLAVAAPACTRPTDEFCEALSSRRSLDDLARAISRRDEPAIQRGLADLRELERTAPDELLADVRLVLDTASEAVRTVTRTAEGEGADAPVDLTALNDQLAEAEPAAQRITSFADRNCGIGL